MQGYFLETFNWTRGADLPESWASQGTLLRSCHPELCIRHRRPPAGTGDRSLGLLPGLSTLLPVTAREAIWSLHTRPLGPTLLSPQPTHSSPEQERKGRPSLGPAHEVVPIFLLLKLPEKKERERERYERSCYSKNTWQKDT